MFTGIVEHLGSVATVDTDGRGTTIAVDSGPLASDLSVGDSVAVNGVCLTVVAVDPPRTSFQVVGETVDRTNLGELQPGSRVNLERPMAASGRFDGHIVQGHVDGQATILALVPDGESTRLHVGLPEPLLRYVVEKGSITLDGVSLTVVSVDDSSVEVALIPHTLAVTTLGSREKGDGVNVEVDVLAKYVERLLGARL